ncbi:MAG: ligase-associated DNA damage response endonuclease PdeM [Pseudomonadota bacterium]
MAEAALSHPDLTILHVQGEMLMPLPEGALWWPDQQTLIVSDLHFEKGSSYASRGQMLPPYDTHTTLTRVECLLDTLGARRVLSLGDSFHDRASETRMGEDSVARIQALTGQCDWIWVEGNHDPDPPQFLGGSAAKEVKIGALTFRHEPTGAAGEVAGHLHPVAKLSGRNRSVRRKCFVTDGRRLVLPALGAFTGGLNILDQAFEEAFPDGGLMAFTLGREQVIAVPTHRLIPDLKRRSGQRWRF